MSYKKIDKEFCLTDDSVNVYGYRCLTNGLQLERFAPPIGFLMHDREGGVAVKWEDFRIDGGKLFAKPLVNTARYPQLAGEIEAGFYQGASIGKIVALETSDEAKYKLEGQTGVTVLKWFPRECSIVDIPGNYSALAQLYDDKDNLLLDLSDQLNNNKMETIALTPGDLKLLDLADNATGAVITARLQALVDKATKADTLEKEISELKSGIDADKVSGIIAKGLADKKLTQELADKLKTDYAGKSGELQALVDALPAQTLVTGKIEGEVPEKWKGKTFADLYYSGELQDLKKECPEYYEELKSNA